MKRLLRSLAFLGIFLACLAFGFSWRDIQRGELPGSRPMQRLFASVSGPAVSSEQIFKEAYRKILSSYAKPLKGQDLKYAGIAGMMASLGDPHTTFMPPRQHEEFTKETRAHFVGVGAQLGPDPMGAKARRVFESGPGYKAGLRSGDIITEVDGKSCQGKSVEEIVDMIRGDEGVQVRLTIIREGTPKPISLRIIRARVTIPTVDSEYLPKQGVGYVAVSAFSEPTADQFDEELAKLEKNPLRGLVIDVRDNPGGLLESARELLSRFTEDRLVVKMRFRNGDEEVAKTYTGFAKKFPYPVVVLINEGSASAAEIFAGVLKDYRLATLVGEHTYGKASVQNVFELVDRSSAKITIARYYLPGGDDISRKVDADGLYASGGLKPDFEEKIDFLVDFAPGEPDKDPQLARAIQLITAKAP